MSLDVLLKVLSDGEFHSGDELGQVLGVSRTAVWKQLKKIEDLHLPLLSIKGKGYRVEGGLDLLSSSAIESALSADAAHLITELDIHDVVDSTNLLAMQKASTGGKGYVCTAEQQLAGRGRRGKAWASPYACNLYLSVVWEFSGGAAALEGLSLAVGVAIVDALKNAGIDGASLKWPNDVLFDSQKLAGVLLEMTGDASGQCQVVVGIGLNVAMPKGQTIDQPWVDVRAINPKAANRNQVLALLLNELMPLLANFEKDGFSTYRERWMQLDAFYNKEVAMTLGESVVLGAATGVDETGALQLKTAAGLQTFNGGEVSLRIAK